MTAGTEGHSNEGPSSKEQEQIAQAAELYRPLRRAAFWAKLSGWTLLFFGASTLLFALIDFEVVGLVLGGALTACGMVEVNSVKLIQAGDPHAFTRLGWNQWAVFLLIAGYAGLQMLAFDSSDAMALMFSADTNEGLAELERQGHSANPLGGLGDMIPKMIYAMYTAVILLSFLFQGMMARKYFSLREKAERYSSEVPEWIRRVVQGLSV